MHTPDAQESCAQPGTILGLTQRLDMHPDHGAVLWVEGHRGNYLTGPQLDAYIATLQDFRTRM